MSSTDDDAAFASRVVGGLLLGAALVALVKVFAPVGAAQPYVALSAATAAMLGARLAERHRGGRGAEAGYASALVALGSVPFYEHAPALAAGIAAALVALFTLRRGRADALALLAVPAFYVAARHASGAPMLRGVDALAECAFLLSLLAYGALLVRERAERWSSYALALHGITLTIATLPLLDALGVTDPGIGALAAGAMLGALFALALRMGERPLAGASGALLAFAGAAFAFLALGPALAAMVLLLLGAALVWHAEHVRVYFRSRAARAPR